MNNRIALILSSIILFLIALPTTWMQVRNPKIFTPIPHGVENALRDQTIDITGLAGDMSFLSLPSTPLWLVVCSGILASLILLFNSLRILSVPKLVVSLPLMFTTLFSVGAIYSAIYSSDVTIGIGAIASVSGTLIVGYAIVTKEKKGRTSRSIQFG